jgi:predicted TIM-barrel fold metal-dependent hydrolase
MKYKLRILFAAGLLSIAATPAVSPATAADILPLVDAHLHYSHDAWDGLPPKDAIAALRRAGLKKAFVSSSSDDGTQMLYAEAPDLIVPVLRPYRKRGELGTWFRDPTVIEMLESRLKKGGYAGIGEFHIFGADADGEIFRQVVQLAKKYRVFLHAHSDADAVDRIFRQWPEATVLWAHSGFEEPDGIRPMLAKHKRLWSDLAFRSNHGAGGKADPEWAKLFAEFPDRFMIGTDTYTPERWYFVEEHANWSRSWLQSLPRDLAERIAWKNAMALANWALQIKD